LNDKIASGAVVARTMGQYQYENCNPQHPTSVMTILGTEDYESIYNGVVYNGVTYYISADDTHEYWSNYNNTDINPVETELPNNNTNDGSTVTKRIWENGNECVSVVEYRVNGGGHDWPGSFGNMDINSDNEIWNFVSKYSLEGLIYNCSLSTENHEIQHRFSYYPNPIENLLKINNQSNIKRIFVSDLTGKVIYESDLITGENVFDISVFNPGLYNVKIGLKTFKIVKK
jgi:polyhydroxybutyrate depolymerase